MFAAEIEPVLGSTRRMARHAPVPLEADLEHGGFSRALCKVVDVTRRGARLQTYSPLEAGSMVWLTMPRIGHCAARIVWADDFSAGCEFRIPLSDDDLALLTGS